MSSLATYKDTIRVKYRPPSEVSASRNDSEIEAEKSKFFDLQPPITSSTHVKVEDLAKRLFSADHLHFILQDQVFFYRFSTFINQFKPHLVPNLVRYREMRKSMKAIEYANSVSRTIRWPSNTELGKSSKLQAAVMEVRFEDDANAELQLLCAEALPAFITHDLVDVVVDLVANEVMGRVIPALKNLVGNLAEVFCLTDPSCPDNPIIYASDEFHRTTQYGRSYAIDRNCRFLQGPGTDKFCTKRIAEAASEGRESNEILLNYRRDGTPFINLLMCAPLFDDKGSVRYFIGAPIDITGLIENGHGIDSFARLLQNDSLARVQAADESCLPQFTHHRKLYLDRKRKTKDTLDTLQDLSALFSQDESDIVTRSSRGPADSDTSTIVSTGPISAKQTSNHQFLSSRPMSSASPPMLPLANLCLNRPGSSSLAVYRHYMLIRPYPSLQITFVSPSLRIPGILRTHLFSKLGGPVQTMEKLERSLRDGVAVTARVAWIPRRRPGERRRVAENRDRGRGRVVRCTPLRGGDGKVGVWMVVLVPERGSDGGGNGIIGGGSHQKRIYDTRSSMVGVGTGAKSSEGGGLEDQRVWRGGKGRSGEESSTE